jgi:CubicO group peptidase (beta-lactamase class C family)
MKKLIATFMLAGFTGALHADAIDDYVDAELTRQRIPGASVAIMENGVLKRAQGYGYANLEHRVPVHPDTVFQSGSIGKMFTATAILLLAEDGKLKLDESIRTYLADAPRWWQPVTVRHLLTHTSGLHGDPGFDLRKDYSDEELLKIIYARPKDFDPGARWSYSNLGYAVLGLLVKRVSGEFYGDLLKQRVFGPLGMSTAQVIDDLGIVPNRAAGYEIDGETTRNQEWVAPTGNSTADGSLYLTALDYAKWDAGLRAREILEPESYAEMWKPVRLQSGKTYPYGFGWSLEQGAGQDIVQHGGAWQGFTTFLIRFLGDEVTVVVLTNRSGSNPEGIARHIAGLYLPKLALPAASPIEDREPAVTERLRSLLQRVAAGSATTADFPWVSKADFEKYGPYLQKRVQALGQLTELELFGVKDQGDDRVYQYRARGADGIASVDLTLDPQGRNSSFGVSPVPAWDTPLSP